MFSRILAAFALAALPVSLSGTAAAQSGDAIVVTGEPQNPETIRRFVEAAGSRTLGGQIPRWGGAICPQVTGLRDELNEYIRQTVIAVAQTAGVSAAGANCEPNLTVAFLADPAEFVETLRERRPAHLASLDLHERAALAASDAPALSWGVGEMRTRDGRLVGMIDRQQLQTDSDQNRAAQTTDASRISNALRADFTNVYLLIDLDRLDGVTMQQLSAFAAMQGLAAPDTARPIEPAVTILNLFHQRAEAPADITDWDIAYLRGLYGAEPAQAAPLHKSAIAERMAEALEELARDRRVVALDGAPAW